MSKIVPEFPIKVVFNEDGAEWILENEEEAACTLEWFNSEDPEENAIVTDHYGRIVRLKVEQLKIQICELL
jgi:hypothetical protein